MTLETLRFLRDLLTSQSLAVGADDFRTAVQTVSRALDELDEAITAAVPSSRTDKSNG